MQLTFSREELMAEHEYATPHEACGERLHGGFDDAGNYIPPRSLIRQAAISNWSDALRSRGDDLLDANAGMLLQGKRYPNLEQQRYLVRAGLGQVFWNNLTTTGKIEGRGRALAEMTFPELADIVVEDISGMAIGHLNKGLLVAHGIDEGGEPEKGIGGHDVMWFVARDLLFGKEAYPDVEPPESIGRPNTENDVALLDGPYQGLIAFLVNLLIIEFRAEIGFANSQAIMRTAELFSDRRADAELAAEIIERIRTDELIHVESLKLYLGELRSVTLKTADGKQVPGSDIIDPLWTTMTHWATREQPQQMAEQTRSTLEPWIKETGSSEALREFQQLEAAA